MKNKIKTGIIEGGTKSNLKKSDNKQLQSPPPPAPKPKNDVIDYCSCHAANYLGVAINLFRTYVSKGWIKVSYKFANIDYFEKQELDRYLSRLKKENKKK